MEASHNPGIFSLKQAPSELEASLRVFHEISNSSIIIQLKKALGVSAELHLVGGTVRDVILGGKNTDIDLATRLKPEEVLKGCEASGIRVIATGLKHGTVTCVIDGQNIEITTFRAGRGGDGFSDTIEEDLQGRDFTINALAYSVNEDPLYDLHGGISDLKNKVLRTVGDPADRFREDPLRILRMVRFGYAAGRTVDAATEDEARKLASSLEKISIERIRNELEKIILNVAPAEGVRALERLGLPPYTWPELIPTVGFEQNKYHKYDVFEHTMDVLSQCPPERILRLAAIYHDIGKAHTLSVDEEGNRHFYEHEKISDEICQKSMQKLKFSNNDIHAVSLLVRMHMRPFNCGPSGVRRLLRDLGEEFPRWREFKNADRPAVFDDDLLQELKDRFDGMVSEEFHRREKSKQKTLAVNGDDLKSIGVQPGPQMGKILKALENVVLDDPDMNTKEKLLTLAEEYVKGHVL